MEWKNLKEKVYYEDGGSLRDIYVFETTIEDWERWIDLVNQNYRVEFYNGFTEEKSDQIDVGVVKQYWEGKTEMSNWATIFIYNFQIKCYFFISQEIENDISPKEFLSIEDHLHLMEYLKAVSGCLNKKVFLTEENYQKEYIKEATLIEVEKEKVKITRG